VASYEVTVIIPVMALKWTPWPRSYCFLFLLFLYSAVTLAKEPALAPLPSPVSNNAVAVSYSTAGVKLFSFMGIGPKKTWDALTTSAYEMDLRAGTWDERRPVPGVTGRLAASAVALGGEVFIFGGYVIDEHGEETTLSDVNIYVPFEDRYYRGKDIPVPVDDAVAAVYHDRYIYLIGGWSKNEAVRNVQVYDTEKDQWLQATPIPGTPVFGHAGAVLGDTIIYVDGAYKNPDSKGPKFLASSECWMGKLPNPKKGDITKIEWEKLPPHPGNAHYRIGAGAEEPGKKARRIYFSGGTDNPYNYNGIGYNGEPAEPSAVTFAFDVRSEQWETINANTPNPTMDHRGLLATHRGLLLIGGMEKDQKVTGKVTVVNAEGKK
jgi:N-acetylneuraminic acid mutarotase